MVRKIGRETINEVREKTDIVALVQSSVMLKRSGVSWKGLCPFHDESTPSLHVTPSKNLWHCFGCGEGGDAIDFVQLRDGFSFSEAVEFLANQVNINVEYVGVAEENFAGVSPATLLKINTVAHNFFRSHWEQLDLSHPGKVFLQQKNLYTEELDAVFSNGWSPHPSEAGGKWDSLTQHLLGEGFNKEDLLESGLVVANNQGGLYDKFRGRVMWTVRNPAGNPVGFGGRRIFEGESEGAKYVNSPETVLYKKSDILYNLNEARKFAKKFNRVIVTEGYTDVMALTAVGKPNVVAVCGTAFGEKHVALLKRVLGESLTRTSGVSDEPINILFMFDGDDAGKKAALRTFGVTRGLEAETYATILPAGEDPSDLVSKNLHDTLVRNAESTNLSLAKFVIDTKVGNHNLRTPESVALAVDEVAVVISQINNPTVREGYTKYASTLLGVPFVRLDALAKGKMRSAKNYNQKELDGENLNPAKDSVPSSRLSASNPLNRFSGNPNYYAEEEAIVVGLQHPHLSSETYQTIHKESYTSPLLGFLHEIVVFSHKNVSGSQKLISLPEWRDVVLSSAHHFFSEYQLSVQEQEFILSFINRLFIQPLRTTDFSEESIAAHIEDTLQNVVRNYSERKLVELKQKIATVDPQSEEYTSLWEAIMELNKK